MPSIPPTRGIHKYYDAEIDRWMVCTDIQGWDQRLHVEAQVYIKNEDPPAFDQLPIVDFKDRFRR